MNLEETKKIIENKIEAEDLTRNVRSQIKSCIDQKQNLREGFKETFEPLIASRDAVKTSIDNQQNKLIKQLQENQLALTEELDRNILALTQGFDKMEVKQLPSTSLPAIEGDEITYKISNRDLNKIVGFKNFDEDEDAFFSKENLEDILERNEFYKKNKYDIVEEYLSPGINKIEIVPKIKDEPIYKISVNDYYRITGQENKLKENGEKDIKGIKESDLNRIISESYNENKYKIDILKNPDIVQVFKRPPPTKPLIYEDKDMNKFLDKEDEEILDFYSLKLPSFYKDASLEEFQEALDTGLRELKNIKRSFKTKVRYETNSDTGLLEPKPTAKIRPNPITLSSIKDYKTLSKFNDNMHKLKYYKEIN